MSDVFLSYSRRDRTFIEELQTGLEAAHRSVWVDLREIPPSADWRDEITQAIISCDTFICVLSPDYATSTVCRDELEIALANHKRLIPIVLSDVTAREVAPSVAALNWIFFRERDDRRAAFDQLLAALDTDLPYLRSGTRLLMRAKEWEGSKRNASYTLRGKDLAEAEQWLATSGGKQPAPSQEQTQYIVASRRASSSRQRTVIGSLTAGLLITLVLSIISTTLYKVTSDQNVALRGHAIAGLANDALANGHLDQGLLLAVAASKQHDDFDTRNALLNGLDSAAYLTTVLVGAGAQGAASHLNYRDVAYADNGNTLMALDKTNGTVYLWNGSTNQLVRSIPVPKSNATDASGKTLFDDVTDAAISSDGLFIATKSSLSGVRGFDGRRGAGLGIIVDASSGDTTNDVNLIDSSIRFSPDGNLLAWSECSDVDCLTERVGILNIATGEVDYVPLSGTSAYFSSVTLAFSSDGSKLAAGILDNQLFLNQQLGGTVEIFDLKSQTLSATIHLSADAATGPIGSVVALAFTPDGSELAIAGNHDTSGSVGQVLFWNVAQGGFISAPFVESDGTISALAFSPDGQYLVTGCGSGSFGVRIWSMEQRTAVSPILKQHTQTINSIAFSPDGRHFASAGADGLVLIWSDVPYTGLSHLIDSGTSTYTQTAFSPDGALLAIGGENAITLWDVKLQVPLKTLTIPPEDRNNSPDALGGLAFSPDGKALAAGDELAQIFVWNVAAGSLVAPPLRGHKPLLPGTAFGFITDLSFSLNGKWLVSTAFDQQAILWNVSTWTADYTFSADSVDVREAAFSPDGRYLAVTEQGKYVAILDTQTHVESRMDTHGTETKSLAFYPHRPATLATLDATGKITTWNAVTGAAIGESVDDGRIADTTYQAHLVFNAAGTQLISSHDLTLTIWDVSQFGHPTRYVRSIVPEFSQLNVSLSPDGRYVAIATSGVVEVRYITLADWRAAACAIAHRNLTQSEWQQFIPDVPYQKVC